MAFKRIKIDSQYPDNMPIAATFMATEDSPHLKLIIKPVEEKADPTGKRSIRVDASGMRVTFRAGTYRTRNSDILAGLLAHRAFGQSSRGFTIDERDETGFWRATGHIETATVLVAKVKGVPSKPDPAKLKNMLAAVKENVKVRTGEDGSLAPVDPLVKF